MELCNILNKYQDEKLYNIKDVIVKFKEYYGLTLEELENYLSNYKVMDKEEILSYIKLEYQECCSLKEIFDKRMIEYNYYDKVLKILSTKGLNYLMIIKYLSDCKDKNISKEKILEDIEIYHYSSVVTGRDINRLLIVLFHLLTKFNKTLDTINEKKGFLNQRLCIDSLMFEQEELYPSEKLIMIDEYYLDKTSLKTRKLTR